MAHSLDGQNRSTTEDKRRSDGIAGLVPPVKPFHTATTRTYWQAGQVDVELAPWRCAVIAAKASSRC